MRLLLLLFMFVSFVQPVCSQDSSGVVIGFNFGATGNILSFDINEGYEEVLGTVTASQPIFLGGVLGISFHVPVSQSMDIQASASGHLSGTKLDYEFVTGTHERLIVPLGAQIDVNAAFKMRKEGPTPLIIAGASFNQFFSEAGNSTPVLKTSSFTVNAGMGFLKSWDKLTARPELLFRFGVTPLDADGDDVYTRGIENVYRHTLSLILHIY